MSRSEQRVEQLFLKRQYDQVIKTLHPLPIRTRRERALLGMAYVRLGQAVAGEPELVAAAELGDLEAAVELGSCWLLQDRAQEAIEQLEQVLPKVGGALRLIALRWLGVTRWMAGQPVVGTALLEQAWRGALAANNVREEVLASHRLAGAMLWQKAEWQRAEIMLKKAITYFDETAQYWLQADAGQYLFYLYTRTNNRAGAEKILSELRSLYWRIPPFYQTMVDCCEAYFERLNGDEIAFKAKLEKVWHQAQGQTNTPGLLWTTLLLADIYSLEGSHIQALRTLQSFPGINGSYSVLEARLVDAILQRRRGSVGSAIKHLEEVIQQARERDELPVLARASLHLASAYLQTGQSEKVAKPFTEACRRLSKIGLTLENRRDLMELSPLLLYAEQHEELSSYAAVLLDESLEGSSEHPRVTVKTFGAVELRLDGRPVRFRLPGTIPVLIYLSQHPDQTVKQISWQLFGSEEHLSYVRQCILLLRETLGENTVVLRQEGRNKSGFYRLGVEVKTDLDDLYTLLNAGRLTKAINIYDGPFLSLSGFEARAWLIDTGIEVRDAIFNALRQAICEATSPAERNQALALVWSLVDKDYEDQDALELYSEAARRAGDVQAQAHAGSLLSDLGNHLGNDTDAA